MGVRSSQPRSPNLNKTDGHLIEYFRNSFSAGGGGTNAGAQTTQAKQEQANHFATEQTSSVESFLSMGPERPRAENVEDPVPARGSQIDQAKLRLSLRGLARTRLPPAPCRGRVSARGAALDSPGNEHRV